MNNALDTVVLDVRQWLEYGIAQEHAVSQGKRRDRSAAQKNLCGTLSPAVAVKL
jgi:hypothetical protein